MIQMTHMWLSIPETLMLCTFSTCEVPSTAQGNLPEVV